MAKAEWNVRAGNSEGQISAPTGPVPLKWASDAATGAPRYIHDPDIVSQAARAAYFSLPWTPASADGGRHFR